MNKEYPITDKAKHTIIGTNNKRSTIEEIDIKMEKIINEKISKKDTPVVEEESTKV